MKPVVVLSLCIECVFFPLASADGVVSLCQTAGYGNRVQPCSVLHRCPLARAAHPITRHWLLLNHLWSPAQPLVGATVRLLSHWWVPQCTCSAIGRCHSAPAQPLVGATVHLLSHWSVPQYACSAIGGCHSAPLSPASNCP